MWMMKEKESIVVFQSNAGEDIGEFTDKNQY